VQAAIAVVEHGGRYLICRRHQHDSFGGYWEFPGGKRHPGERWATCVRRELREELGVEVLDLAPLGRLFHRTRSRVASFRVFRCRLAGAKPQPLAAQALRWVPARHLGRYRFPPANRPLLERLTRRGIITVNRRRVQ